MRSSSGARFIALDHVRALAALMVFLWHFCHGRTGHPVPFHYAPALFPLSLFDEGHTGVALFMTLSGYLFAKLLDGKTINYQAFLWNRILRLLPLLAVVILLVGIKNVITHDALQPYVVSVLTGLLLPSLPHGGWSITVEFHYYVILPLFLWMLRKSKLLPLSLVFGAIVLRLCIYLARHEIQYLAYWTIVGRVDQFALGMLLYQFRTLIARRHFLVISVLSLFAAFYWCFDRQGGFYNFPQASPLWIVLPTMEGLAYAVGIAWYESSFVHSTAGVSAFIGRIGEYSYSIYLLHFFVVFQASKFVNQRIMDISNFYIACLWGSLFFVLMMPVGYLSFRFIEAPFLKLRRAYATPLVPTPKTTPPVACAGALK